MLTGEEGLEAQLPEPVITVYAPACEAVNDCELAPFIGLPSLYHWLPLTEDDVKTTLLPAQILVAAEAVTTGVDDWDKAVTDTAEDVNVQLPLVTATV